MLCLKDVMNNVTKDILTMWQEWRPYTFTVCKHQASLASFSVSWRATSSSDAAHD